MEEKKHKKKKELTRKIAAKNKECKRIKKGKNKKKAKKNCGRSSKS